MLQPRRIKRGLRPSRRTGPPAVITVAGGGKRLWVNHDDDDAHDTVADADGFRSSPMDPRDHYAFAFSKPGTYGYGRGPQPHLVGKVVVTP